MTKDFLDENDVVIVGAYRTPIGKAKKGKLAGFKNDLLISEVIKGTLDKINLNPNLIDEVVFGHCLSPLNGTTSLRIGALRAGLSTKIPVSTVNRQCASGLEAMSILVNKIKLDQIEIGLGGGFESMTGYSYGICDTSCLDNDPDIIKDCTLPMGETAEILAHKHKIPRSKCDVYAFKSHNRAIEAQKSGKFESEIVGVKSDEGDLILEDDCLRPTTLPGLKSLKPAFLIEGVCTAGNSSQLADGASTVLLMKRKKAESLGLEIKGVVVDYVVIGVEPRVMGEGPVPAIRLLLEKNNLKINDVSYFEINEAFSPQAVFCIEELGIDYSKVNVYGGSIALGHPLGSTGTRLVCTLLNVMEKEGIKGYGVVSLCVGTGFGVAMLIKK
jgi:acetyl-CoA acyltransferase 1